MSEKEENQTEILPNNPALIAHSEALPQEEKERLQKEIFDKFLEIQKRGFDTARNKFLFTDLSIKEASEWNEFIKQFFEKQKSNYPQIFKDINDLKCFTLVIDGQTFPKIICHGLWNFYFPVHVISSAPPKTDSDKVFISEIDFRGANFYEGFLIQDVKSEYVTFGWSTFYGKGHLSRVEFENSNFYRTHVVKEFIVDGCIIRNMDDNLFRMPTITEEAEEVEIKIINSVLGGDKITFKNAPTNSPAIKLKSFLAKNTIFESPVIFDLQLKECPDFSEAHFLKKVFIKETWLEEGKSIKNITALDEGKFRFFKNYFAKEEGNHFKEAEYFSYEMKAREKGKLKKLTEDGFDKSKLFGCVIRFFKKIDLAAKKVCRFLFKKFGKIFQWLGSYFDLCLFKLYKWTSDYGMSIWRPAFWLLVSGAILKFIFPTMSLSDAAIKTISPIKDLEFLPLSNFENLVLVIFTLVNLSLIFLLLLGVRNKFKIK